MHLLKFRAPVVGMPSGRVIIVKTVQKAISDEIAGLKVLEFEIM